MAKKWSWKHDSGDHEPTYDWYLWVDKKPTNHCISQSSGVYYYYIDGVEKGMSDTLQDAKDNIIGRLRY